jgi:hypothetical protein
MPNEDLTQDAWLWGGIVSNFNGLEKVKHIIIAGKSIAENNFVTKIKNAKAILF